MEEETPQNEPVVLIEGHNYEPVEMTVSRGTEVKFINNDTDEHTVTSDADSFNVEIAPGETQTVGFDTPGEYDYHCNYHPDMKGTIIVE